MFWREKLWKDYQKNTTALRKQLAFKFYNLKAKIITIIKFVSFEMKTFIFDSSYFRHSETVFWQFIFNSWNTYNFDVVFFLAAFFFCCCFKPDLIQRFIFETILRIWFAEWIMFINFQVMFRWRMKVLADGIFFWFILFYCYFK